MNAETHGTFVLPSGYVVRTHQDPLDRASRGGIALVVAATLAVAAILAVLLPNGGGHAPSSASPGADRTIADPVIVDYARTPPPGR
jgi:hypothetical protein